MVAVPLAVPMLLCIFIRRAPSWSALTSVGAAVVVAICGQYSKQIFGHTWSFQLKLFANFFSGVAGFVLTLPFWYTASAEYRQRVAVFFERMLRPRRFCQRGGKGNDLTQMTYLGAFAMVTGGSLCLLMLVSGTMRDRLCIAFVGGSVMLIGIGMSAVGNSARGTLRRRSESETVNRLSPSQISSVEPA